MNDLSHYSLLEIPLKRIDGTITNLSVYKGKVLLVVNVASKCGLTPQYEGLEALYRQKASLGLEILGFPANDFMEQEPGSESEILDFCSTTYDVTFPLFAKISVKGPEIHPLYSYLIKAQPVATGEGPMREKLSGYGISSHPPDILWNFEKFLIGRNGKVKHRFSPDITADDPRLITAITHELAMGI